MSIFKRKPKAVAILGCGPAGMFAAHAFNDALMTAMMYVALRDLKQRGVRIARARSHAAVFSPMGA